MSYSLIVVRCALLVVCLLSVGVVSVLYDVCWLSLFVVC